ncbi:MAG: hypothetical protein WAM39_22440 [Bryobacteraceae bacterium]
MPASFVAAFPPEFPFPGPQPGSPKPESAYPPTPVIYETTELENMTLRAYAAVHLRVPDSGIDWLDEMIRQSRELDKTPQAEGGL